LCLRVARNEPAVLTDDVPARFDRLPPTEAARATLDPSLNRNLSV
jgi:hypothetical protein